MKWYHFDTMFRSLKDDLREYLQSQRIRYELSGARAGWHFEVLASPEDVRLINAFIDSVTITEQP
jgi:hypothetical protein